MSDYIVLLGAEQVQTAATTISQAAHEMKMSAMVLHDVQRQQQDFMNDWLNRLEEILKKSE